MPDQEGSVEPRTLAGTLFLALALIASGAGCTGQIADPAGGAGSGDDRSGGDGRPGGSSADPLSEPGGLGPQGIQRLSRAEYRATLEVLLGFDIAGDVELLPEDAETPFDNDYGTQLPSAALVEGARSIADRATETVMADPTLRDRLVGCTPSGPSDEACFRDFVERFGRLALRRPLSPEEIDRYAAVQSFSVDAGDFYVGAALVTRALLQDMELLYRIEIGEPVEGTPGLFRLTPFELASRASYLLTGGPPDDALLDAAASGELVDDAVLREEAARLLATDAGRERVERFHAMWLGYEQMPVGGDLGQAFRSETDALVERVIFEERASWLELFEAEESFVTAELAEHYGLEAPATPEGDWVPYGDTGRRGLLSHGSFLSGGTKFGDTSPVLRGILVLERLLCREVPDPPPMVNTDEPPVSETGSDCKWDRYAAHRTGGCAGCHSQIDPIGFGLEGYDAQGRYRSHDPGLPECTIQDDGEVSGLGEFSGPAELGGLLIASGELDLCATRQLFRFAVGRQDTTADDAVVAALLDRFRTGDHRLDELLVELVATEAFRYRWVPPEEE